MSTEISTDNQFYHLAQLKNEDYYSFVQNQDAEFKKVYSKYITAAFLEMKEKGLCIDSSSEDFNVTSYEGHMRDAKRKAIKECAKKDMETGQRCPHELSQIQKTIVMFEKMYDLGDPRAYMIVTTILQHQLTVYRLERYSQRYNPLYERYDKEGNAVLTMNPAEKAKLEFSNAIVSGIKELNNIFEGQKSSVEISGEFSIKDYMDKIVSIQRLKE
jgi:hypothetical protein